MNYNVAHRLLSKAVFKRWLVEKFREDRFFPPSFFVAVIVIILVIPASVTVAVVITFQER